MGCYRIRVGSLVSSVVFYGAALGFVVNNIIPQNSKYRSYIPYSRNEMNILCGITAALGFCMFSMHTMKLNFYT